MSAPINATNGKSPDQNSFEQENIPPPTSSTSNRNTVTRIVSVNMLNTLMDLNWAGTSAGIWKPAEGRHIDMFCDEDTDSSIDTQATYNKIRNVTLKEAELLQSHSTYPFPLAVNVSCLPKCEILESGEKCTFTALPQNKNNKRQILFTADRDFEAENEWKTTYKEYNAHNLETHGVMDVKAAPYMFVKDTHPVIAVLKVNPELIGDDIMRQPKIDGEWFKIGRDVVSKCATAIRKEVLSKVCTHDLTNFHVGISRVDGKEWVDLKDMSVIRARTQPAVSKGMTATDIEETEQLESQKILYTPFEYNARIKLTYELGD